MANIKLFENAPIRTAWDEEKEEWYFSIVDVVGALTDQADYDGARNYWKVLKKRLVDEGNQSVTNCNQLKMKSPKLLILSSLSNEFLKRMPKRAIQPIG